VLHVLDRNMQPVPVGAVGELYIGGPGQARGYIGRPGLTAGRFVPDPVSGKPGARLYRTGDHVRWLPDGNIEFIGRVDFQVKLRGYRIELGEIEAVLSRHPNVAHVVAMLREDRPGDKRLVVYVVLLDPAGPGAAELRRFLQDRLPDYMVPSIISVLDELPLNPNGKVDRGALPVPRFDRLGSGADYVAPRAPLEETLARVWAEVLGMERVGVNDNFFELGGHSLLAARLLTRLEEVLDQPPRLSVLFQAPTVAAFAEALQSGTAAAAREIIPLRTGGSRPPLFCVPGILGMGFIFVDLARQLGDDQPVYALQARGFTGDVPDTSVEAIAAYFVESMRSVQPAGPYWLCGYSMGGAVAYDMARQLTESGDQIAFVGMIDAPCPATSAADREVEASVWDGLVSSMGIRLDGRTLERLVRLGPEQLSEDELDRVLTSGLGPAGMTIDELRPMGPVLGGNFQAFWQYRPPPQSFRITFFRACEPYPPRGPVDAPDGGWGEVAPVDVRFVSGLHHTVVRESHAGVLAGEMRVCLQALYTGRGQ
jgi:thioesterase domain-containing protein